MNANRLCIYDSVRFYFVNVPRSVRNDFTLFYIYSDINENFPFRSLFHIIWQTITATTCEMMDHISDRSINHFYCMTSSVSGQDEANLVL